jgi:4-amino-4-deoxychorismate lyase
MSLLLETIKCKDGKLFNLPFHQARFDQARRNYYGLKDTIHLEEILKIPNKCKNGLFRCRVIYAGKIEKIEFLPHQYRPVDSLRLVKDSSVNYDFKYADRRLLEELFAQRGDCDDILIVKNGCVTDSFTANVVFFDGLRWWTPDTPLLPGTQRARLLHEKKIFECRITLENLPKYSKVGLINALQDLNEMPVVSAERIITF